MTVTGPTPRSHEHLAPMQTKPAAEKTPVSDLAHKTIPKVNQKRVAALQDATHEDDDDGIVAIFKKALKKHEDFSLIVKALPDSDDQEHVKATICQYLTDEIGQAAEDEHATALQTLFAQCGDDIFEICDNFIQMSDDKGPKEFLKEELGKYFKKELQEAADTQNIARAASLILLAQKTDSKLKGSFEKAFETAPAAVQALMEEDQIAKARLAEAFTNSDFGQIKKILRQEGIGSDQVAPILEGIRPKLAPGQQQALDRILGYTNALRSDLHEKKPLAFLDALKIAFFVEKRLQEGIIGPEYVSRGDKDLKRALILESKSFIVISKKAGILQARGAEHKVSSAARICLLENNKVQTNTQFVCVVNSEAKEKPGAFPDLEELSTSDVERPETPATNDVQEMIRQAELAQRVNGDVHVIVQHTTKTGKVKVSVIEERYDHNLGYYSGIDKEKSSEALPLNQLKQVLQGVGMRLAKLYELGFAHNDLNGRNIVLTISPTGVVKAKPIDFSTRLEGGYGTAVYTSPEHFGGRKTLPDPQQGQADDMYALGCALEEALHKRVVLWAPTVARLVEGELKHDQDINTFTDEQLASRFIDEELLNKFTNKEADLREAFITEQLKPIKKLLEEQVGSLSVTLDRQYYEYEILKLQAKLCSDPERKRYLDLAIALLNPDPEKRLTIHGMLEQIAAL